MTRSALAVARPNIALIKYWGKRDRDRNLPATGSLSLTLSGMSTRTRVTFRDDLPQDHLVLDGQLASPEAHARVIRVLDQVRRLSGITTPAEVFSDNDFPTAAGLASSASGMAALAVAASRAAGLDLDLGTLAGLARMGSGSAPRSLLGGLVWLPRGEDPEGLDCVPHCLHPPEEVPWGLVMAWTGRGPKAVGSTDGMEHTRLSSPYYDAWLDQSRRDLEQALIHARALDLAALGPLMEANAMAMHACALAARPPLRYWNGTTLAVMDQVLVLRRSGLRGWMTIDAGPHVKVLCPREDAETWAEALARVPGVLEVRPEVPGPGVEAAP